jgi:hypothetical protein
LKGKLSDQQRTLAMQHLAIGTGAANCLSPKLPKLCGEHHWRAQKTKKKRAELAISFAACTCNSETD